MGRASSLKKQRREQKAETRRGPEIHLQSPEQDNFEQFIVGNAIHLVELAMPTLPPHDVAAIEAQSLDTVHRCIAYVALQNTIAPTRFVVGEQTGVGQTVVICGAGPSLAEHAEAYCRTADQVWGCNSALTWLVDHGYPVTHGFAVDQTAEMCAEWATAPDVEYLIASTVHVHLTEYLRLKERRIRFFHNYVGIKKAPVEWPDDAGVMKRAEYEDWLYALLYPGTVRAGSGLNSVTRAIDVALVMGFAKIIVLGADCSLRVTAPKPDAPVGSPAHLQWLTESVQMHADGGHALASGATMMTLEADIDGRHWTSKPDMVISAEFLVRMARRWPHIDLVGDTLPNAIMHKDDSWFDRFPSLVDSTGKRIMLTN